LSEHDLDVGTRLSRPITVAIFDKDDVLGVEIVVLRGLRDGALDIASSLSVDAPRELEAPDVHDLREAVMAFFSAEDEESRRKAASFSDLVVFARQVPVENSPIDNVSLAELWAQSRHIKELVAAYVGVTPLLIAVTAIGTVLLRPLNAITKAIGDGLHDPVKEFTDLYARRWLGVSEHDDPGRGPGEEAAAAVLYGNLRATTLRMKREMAAEGHSEALDGYFADFLSAFPELSRDDYGGIRAFVNPDDVCALEENDCELLRSFRVLVDEMKAVKPEVSDSYRTLDENYVYLGTLRIIARRVKVRRSRNARDS
jgi:hypothetical protein